MIGVLATGLRNRVPYPPCDRPAPRPPFCRSGWRLAGHDSPSGPAATRRGILPGCRRVARPLAGFVALEGATPYPVRPLCAEVTGADRWHEG
jgi:hypothetical protein